MTTFFARPSVAPEDTAGVLELVAALRAEGRNAGSWFQSECDTVVELAQTASDRDLTDQELARWRGAALTVSAFLEMSEPNAELAKINRNQLATIWAIVESAEKAMDARHAKEQLDAKRADASAERDARAILAVRPKGARETEEALRTLGYSRSAAKGIISAHGLPESAD